MDLSDFDLHEDLGFGACASVVRATLRTTGAEFALKQAYPNPDYRQRLRREILVQAELQHPHVMPILVHDDVHFFWYAMPVASTTLETFREHASWPVGLADVLAQIWSGLTAA